MKWIQTKYLKRDIFYIRHVFHGVGTYFDRQLYLLCVPVKYSGISSPNATKYNVK